MYKNIMEAGQGISQFGKVRCPRHYVLKPGCSPYKIIPNPHTKHMSDATIDYLNKAITNLKLAKGKLRRWTYAKDAQGHKIQDFRNYTQPLITKGFCIEHIYDPEHPICKIQCRGRCLEGIGKPNINAIKRLSA